MKRYLDFEEYLRQASLGSENVLKYGEWLSLMTTNS